MRILCMRFLLPYVPFAYRSPWPHPHMRAVFPLSPPLLFVRRLVASALQMPTGTACSLGLQCGRTFALALAGCFVFRCGMAPASAWGYLYSLGMAGYGNVTALACAL